MAGASATLRDRVAGLALHLPKPLSCGFPQAHPTTGLFDLEAIDAWCRRRNPHLFQPSLTAQPQARDARDVVRERLERFRGG